jgi:hypothetical protein
MIAMEVGYNYNYNYGDLIRIEKQLNVAGRYTTFNKRDIELFASYKRMKREWEWIRETKTE